MHATLLYPGEASYAKYGWDAAWVEGLAQNNVETTVLTGNSPIGPGQFETDLVIPHVLVNDYVERSPLWRLAERFDEAGVPMLNSLGSLAVTADKFKTYLLWGQHGIPQPETHLLSDLSHWPRPDERMVLKPSYCDGGHYVQWAGTLDAAKRVAEEWKIDEAQGGEKRGEPILQEYLPGPQCIRVVAGTDQHLACYKKVTPPGELISHGSQRVHFEPDSELRDLAYSMVESCGGGLMGADVLKMPDGKIYALETNGPFGFDVTDKALHARMGEFVAQKIQYK
jgi:[lysine-biosynthesis-protein LysW]---L-2-aminoadipate ligase